MKLDYYILIFVVIALALGLGLGLGLGSSSSEGGTLPSYKPFWVAGGLDASGGNSNLMYSTDGICWTESSASGASFSNTCRGVAYGKQSDGSPLWVATGNDDGGNGSLMYSTDGICWTKSSASGDTFSSEGLAVAYGKQSNGTSPLWVAAGDDGGNGSLMYSTDGICWTKSSASGDTFSSEGLAVAYGKQSNGSPLWVAAGDNDTRGGGNPNGNLMYSTDGICWTDSSASGDTFSANGRRVAYGKQSDGSPLWVAAGNDGGGNGSLMYSTDGICWTKSSASGDTFSTSGNEVAYGKQSDGSPLWVAAGNDGGNGSLMYSTDGKTWVESSLSGASFSNSGDGVASNFLNPALA
jgi:hypothetical protein